ncbi:ribose 5-phosphate isomerase B [Candidatus Magnetoovum chiemensis]|nr:ribose 5-phosphate isomerase B [Candidatus Magnetoovum chiemensis]
MEMVIALGNDHAGLELKKEIRRLLENMHIEVLDSGTNTEDSVDYPDFGKMVSEKVAQKQADRGILICGTGLGMSIVANKVADIRATLCHDEFTAKMSRLHNDSNILVLGARVTPVNKALEIVKIWLNTDFEGGRHSGRLKKIKDLEDRK